MNLHPVSVCVPVLKRYDMLKNLLASLRESTLKPSAVCIIDNGQDHYKLGDAVADAGLTLELWTPNRPLGVAESWNWFIRDVTQERIIVNDDVTFAPDSLHRMVEAPGPVVSGLLGSNAFSCFLIRDECVAKVGLFDETISPGYAYFEDCDYHQRMLKEGLDITGVECSVKHIGSATLASRSSAEVDDHNRRFLIAQTNYLAKWGKLPRGMEVQF